MAHGTNIRIPEGVENEEAYVRAAEARIKNNARKGAYKRFLAQYEDAEVLRTFLYENCGRSQFLQSLYDQLSDRGSLSPKQVELVRSNIEKTKTRKAELAAIDAKSQHQGTIGQKVKLSLTLKFKTSFESQWGLLRIYVFKDDNDNIYVYKGSKYIDIERGDRIDFSATIKQHGEREGVKQTILARPTKIYVTSNGDTAPVKDGELNV